MVEREKIQMERDRVRLEREKLILALLRKELPEGSLLLNESSTSLLIQQLSTGGQDVSGGGSTDSIAGNTAGVAVLRPDCIVPNGPSGGAQASTSTTRNELVKRKAVEEVIKGSSRFSGANKVDECPPNTGAQGKLKETSKNGSSSPSKSAATTSQTARLPVSKSGSARLLQKSAADDGKLTRGSKRSRTTSSTNVPAAAKESQPVAASKVTQETANVNPAEACEVYYQDYRGNVFVFKIRPSTALAKVHQAYADRVGMPLEKLRFFNYGERLLSAHTYADLASKKRSGAVTVEQIGC